MYCQNCHAFVPDEAKVCGHCGTKLDREAMFPCPSCGEEVPVTAKVCGLCGTRLEEKLNQPAADQPEAEQPKPKKAADKKEAEKKETVQASSDKKKEKKTVGKKVVEADKPLPKAKAKERAKKKIPIWIFGVAALVLAAGAYFLFFQYRPSVECLNGNWAGDVYLDGEKIFNMHFDIDKTCILQAYCGTFSIPEFGYVGRIKVLEEKGRKFYFFAEPNAVKPEAEIPEEYLQCNKNGTLYYESVYDGGTRVESGTLWPN